VCLCVNVWVCVHVCVCVRVYMNACVGEYEYVNVCMCNVCVDACMHVCMFVHVHEWGEGRGRVVQLLLQRESEEALIYHR